MACHRRCRCCCCGFPSIAEIMDRCGCAGGIIAQQVCCDDIVRRCCCSCRRNCRR
ncbi:MAG: hypothetical protein IIY16_03405 [Oscillospiraceae bacterium]|nr:hypothetical protein [Oscillospiraceae bacterium]